MESQDSKIIAAMAYFLQLFIWFLAPLIIIFLKKDDKYVLYHSKQALVYVVIETVFLLVGFGILTIISLLILVNPLFAIISLIGWAIYAIIAILFMVFWVIGIINCFSGTTKPLPFIGWIGEKFLP